MSGSTMLRAIILFVLLVRMGCCAEEVSAQEKSVSDELRSFAAFMEENRYLIRFQESLKLALPDSEFYREQDTYEVLTIPSERFLDIFKYVIYRRPADGVFWVRRRFSGEGVVYGPMTFEDLKSFKIEKTVSLELRSFAAFMEESRELIVIPSSLKLIPSIPEFYEEENMYEFLRVKTREEVCDDTAFVIYRRLTDGVFWIRELGGFDGGRDDIYGPMTYDDLKSFKRERRKTLREVNAEVGAFLEEHRGHIDFSSFKLTPSDSGFYKGEVWRNFFTVKQREDSSEDITYQIYRQQTNYSNLIIQAVSGTSGVTTTYGPMTFEDLKKAVMAE